MCDVCAVQKKVRDVKFCRETARVATVSADGTLMVLDAQLSLIRTVSGSAAPCAWSSHHHKAQLFRVLQRLEVHAGLVAMGQAPANLRRCCCTSRLSCGVCAEFCEVVVITDGCQNLGKGHQ